MYDKRERWAARWTGGILTMTIHSTQRIESVGNILHANMLLSDLLKKLEAYNKHVADRAETRDFRLTRLFKLQYKGQHRILQEARRFLFRFFLLSLR